MLKFKSFKMVLSVGLLIDIMIILLINLLPYMTSNNYVISIVSSLLFLVMVSIFNLIDDKGHFSRDNLLINIIGFILTATLYLFILNARTFTIPVVICIAITFCLIVLLSLKPLWVVD